MKDENNKKIKAFVLITCLLFVVTTVGVGKETYIFAKEETLVPLGAGVGSTDSNTHIGGVIKPEKLYEFYDVAPTGAGQVKDLLWRAQNFTVGTVGDNERFIVTHVDLYLYKIGVPDAKFKVTLKAVDGAGKPTGKILSQGSLDESSVPIAAAFVRINMSSYTLRQSTQYVIVAGAPGLTVGFYVWGLATEGYAGGNTLTSNDAGVTWSYTQVDSLFKIYGKEAQYSTRILGGHIGGG